MYRLTDRTLPSRRAPRPTASLPEARACPGRAHPKNLIIKKVHTILPCQQHGALVDDMHIRLCTSHQHLQTHPVSFCLGAQPCTPLRRCQRRAHIWEVRVAPQQAPERMASVEQV